jgi:transcriptional regulator with XRE-family HTH domain
MIPIARQIGFALRGERVRRGLSQEALTASSGLSERTVRRIENGESMSVHTIDAVLRALRMRLVVRLEPVSPS